MAHHTVTEVNLSIIILINRSFFLSTTITSEPDLLQLREDLSSTGYDSSDFDHCVKVHFTEISQGVFNGKRLDFNVYFVVDVFIAWVPLLGYFESNLVEIWNDD